MMMPARSAPPKVGRVLTGVEGAFMSRKLLFSSQPDPKKYA
jgi:hypothetical protein